MKLNSIITTVAILILLMTANFLAARHPIRLDLTQNRIYTLSPATKSILAELDDVLTIRVYFSRELPPALQPLKRDVDDLLDEYKNAAGSKVQVEHIDPVESAMEEQKVAMMGIPPLQVNVILRDKQEVAKVYLGIAVLYGDEQQIIPVVQRPGNLEYLLDESILMVARKGRAKIAWWEPDAPGSPEGFGYSFMRGAISRRYDVEDLSRGVPLEFSPATHKALVLISPRMLGDEMREAIDGYLAAGGKVIALVDRWMPAEGLTIEPVETDIVALLAGYGVTVNDTIVLDDLNARAAFAGGATTYHIPYPYWPDVRSDGFNGEIPIAAYLESVVMPWTSPLTIAEGARPEGTGAVVATTSLGATAIPGKDANLDPNAAAGLLAQGNHKKFVLISLTDGPFGGKGGPGSEKAKLLVAGSSHWASDRFISMFPNNATLFQNAVDYFAMGDLLIGIRSRESLNRPIVPMPYAARFWFKYINMATGPIAVGLIGLIVLLFRKARRRRAIYRYS